MGILLDWFDSGLSLGAGFHPEATRVLDQGAILCGGWQGSFKEPTAAIYKLADREVELCLEETGKILALEAAGEAVWALRAVGAPARYSLLLSLNAGKDWLDVGRPPIDTRCRLLAVSAEEVWLLGAEVFLRTCDRGRIWQSVEAPGQRSLLKERLALENGRVLLLSQASVLSTADQGHTWRALDLEGGRACAVHGTALLARNPGAGIRLGAATPDGVEWLGGFGHEAEPFRLQVEGDSIRFLAMPAHPERDTGLLYFQTSDRGASWEVVLLPTRFVEGAADLGRRQNGVAIGPEGTLFLPRPR